MNLWKLLAVLVALVTAPAVTRATSCDNHDKAAPAKAGSKAVAPHHDHDNDAASHNDEDSISEDESELHEQMELIGKNFKKLGRLFRGENPDVAQALKLIAPCKKGAVAAKDLVPELIEKMEDGKEKDEALQQYQEQIAKLAKTFTELELVLKEGEIEKAKALVNLLKKQKKDGHNQFIEEDE